IDNDSIELIADVEDTGIGIKKEDIATLFQKQKTDDESDTDSTIDGSGLGLSICYKIIKEMKGDISVHSEYMAGSTFTIKIPQKFTSMDTIAYIPDSRALRILVFEKDKINATFIGRILDSFDIECDFAQNTQDLERLMNVNSYSYVFVANERYNECESVLNNRLVSERVVAFCKLDDNVQISKATTVLTRPIHSLNIAALLKNESNSYVRDITRKGGFECPMATILVVDDNYTNLNVAAALLSKYRANVLTALSGADCLRIIKDQEVDMVFLDYMMPEMNGIDTLERIRKIPGSNIASMPVIALTANVVSGAREMFLEAGFDDFLAKPISIDKMEKILRKYLRRELLVPKNSAGAKQI
ncbi:MAG: response regulator, partial [Lachnospiraceae bacterium]|nr:response regulator [Lachnospiraceae bacterium]